jgi:hypothetical protein
MSESNSFSESSPAVLPTPSVTSTSSGQLLNGMKGGNCAVQPAMQGGRRHRKSKKSKKSMRSRANRKSRRNKSRRR